jgi:hypothetical protein
MKNNITPDRLVAILKKCFTLICVGLLAANFTISISPCWGADKATAPATITLDVRNEPLRNVLEKITKTTRWKIKVPDKWLDRPVTQTLSKVALEEGLKSVLNNTGVDNLLLMYDEYFKVVTVFDTERSQPPSANPLPVQAPAVQGAIVAAPNTPVPLLQHPVGDTGSRSMRRRSRRNSAEEE